MNYVLLWHELCFFMDELWIEPGHFGSNNYVRIMFYYGMNYVFLWMNYVLLCFFMVEHLNKTGSPLQELARLGPPI